MAVCGHQFYGGDANDWIFSTSAISLDGSTTASQILQELFKKHENGECVRKRQQPSGLKVQHENKKDREETKEENENLIVRKIPGKHSFDNFDESQHLNGCPVKWLYNKTQQEKNKRYKVDRVCYQKLAKKEEVKKEKCKNLRDKTPMEVKIHKINLIEKYTTNYDECYTTYRSLFVKKPENQLELETHKRKLAAKLNWKFHDETPDDSLIPSSEIKHNYLPPRPMLGLKPFLSLLLAPNQMTKCCSLTELARNSAKKEKVTSSLSIQSLDFPDCPQQDFHARSTTTSRWGSKSSRLSKKLQIPSQVTINLERNQKSNFKQFPDFKIAGSNPTVKKLNDKPKQTKSLSALFYELRDKSNFRNQSEERFQDLIKDLTMEGQFKIRKFLNRTVGNQEMEDIKAPPMGRDKERWEASAEELNLVCGKIRFFQKRPSPKKPKSAPNEHKI